MCCRVWRIRWYIGLGDVLGVNVVVVGIDRNFFIWKDVILNNNRLENKLSFFFFYLFVFDIL